MGMLIRALFVDEDDENNVYSPLCIWREGADIAKPDDEKCNCLKIYIHIIIIPVVQ